MLRVHSSVLTPETVPLPWRSASATSLARLRPVLTAHPIAVNAVMLEPAGTWPPTTRVP